MHPRISPPFLAKTRATPRSGLPLSALISVADESRGALWTSEEIQGRAAAPCDCEHALCAPCHYTLSRCQCFVLCALSGFQCIRSSSVKMRMHALSACVAVGFTGECLARALTCLTRAMPLRARGAAGTGPRPGRNGKTSVLQQGSTRSHLGGLPAHAECACLHALAVPAHAELVAHQGRVPPCRLWGLGMARSLLCWALCGRACVMGGARVRCKGAFQRRDAAARTCCQAVRP